MIPGIFEIHFAQMYHISECLMRIIFICSLGSTRFFKVARARHKGALVVVKVFVLHDPTLPLVEHKEKLEYLNRELSPRNNCLPFAKPVVNRTLQLRNIFSQ